MKNVIKTGQQLWIGNFKPQFHSLVLFSSETEYRGKVKILLTNGSVEEKKLCVYGRCFW